MNLKSTFFTSLFALLSLFWSQKAQAQLTTNTGVNADQLAATIAGEGVTLLGATLACVANAKGNFTSASSCLPLDSGIILTTGLATGIGNPASSFNSGSTGTGSDPQLTALAGGSSTNDKCVLEFNFVPKGDTVKFD